MFIRLSDGRLVNQGQIALAYWVPAGEGGGAILYLELACRSFDSAPRTVVLSGAEAERAWALLNEQAR